MNTVTSLFVKCFGTSNLNNGRGKTIFHQVEKPSTDEWLNLSSDHKKAMIKYLYGHTLGTKPLRISNKGIRTLSAEKKESPLMNYQLLRPLGEGVYGEVKLYRHKKTNKCYAVKSSDMGHLGGLTNETLVTEAVVSIAVSGLERYVRMKKVLVDKGRKKIYYLMEVLKRLSHQDVLKLAQTHKKDDTLGLPKLGIEILDRHLGNVMKRKKDDREVMVEIDYGMSEVDKKRLYRGLAGK